MDYFLEQQGLIEIGLMNAIEDSIETDKEVGGREKPDMVFNKYSQQVELVGKGINDGFEDGSGRRNMVSITNDSCLEWKEERKKRK
jgi:hypothetical protein